MSDSSSLKTGQYEPGTHPDLPPPPGTVGAVGWLRQNLFSSVTNSVLTILSIALLLYLIPAVLQWAVFDATTYGSDRYFCKTSREIGLMAERASEVNFGALQAQANSAEEIAVKRSSVKNLTDLSRQLAALGSGFKPDSVPADFAALFDSVGVAAIGEQMAAATKEMSTAATQTKLLQQGDIDAFPPEVDAALAATDLAGVQAGIAAMQPVFSAAASNDGACWSLIKNRFYQYMFGFYPRENAWRVLVAAVLMIVAFIPVLFDNVPYRKLGLIYACIFPIIAFFLLVGGLGLPHVETDKFGGLMLTVVIGVTGIVGSLPIGVVLALGRRSEMPVIRVICVAFIEFIRGVPLITILFMGSNMLPLFLPEGVNFDKLLRALIAVTLFSSAYMAEVVRGGLQAIPKGQYEGAMALGLSYWKMMGLIVLPQALKIVIPGIVSSFIGLFKDTTLVSIIGLFDLLLVGKSAITDQKWIGLVAETYAFVGVLYFIFCFSMARYSVWLEEKLHTGHKRR